MHQQELRKAIEARDQAGVVDALEAGAPATGAQRDEESPLQVAVRCNNLEAARALMAWGADPLWVNRHGHSALYMAALDEREAMLELLCSRTSTHQQRLTLARAESDRQERERKRSRAHKLRKKFFDSLRSGRIDRVRKLIPNVKLDEAEDFGLPLLVALELGDPDQIVVDLLEAGADPAIWHDDGPHRPSTCLGMAASTVAPGADRTELTRCLLKYGAYPATCGRWGFNALHEAAYFASGGSGELGGLNLLVHNEELLNSLNDFGQTAWFLAAYQVAQQGESLPPLSQREAVLRRLQQAGADESDQPSLDLVLAAEAGQTEQVKEALAAGATPDACTPVGESALFLAVKAGHLEVARALVEAGADAQRVAPLHGDGTTPLGLAQSEELEDFVKLLGG